MAVPAPPCDGVVTTWPDASAQGEAAQKELLGERLYARVAARHPEVRAAA
jgi:hypothetical protein